ncbi:MAG TPA: hypothetical protein VNZ26_19050 [Vicinamibacterales bacterium]|nr:hypothetical protein [Vicinamibacterales bacterium]
MARHPSHLVELAKRGAEVQFQKLVNEARMLVALFPHLRDSFDPDELPVSFIVEKGSGRTTKRKAYRGPRKVSAASRKGRRRG